MAGAVHLALACAEVKAMSAAPLSEPVDGAAPATIRADLVDEAARRTLGPLDGPLEPGHGMGITGQGGGQHTGVTRSGGGLMAEPAALGRHHVEGHGAGTGRVMLAVLIVDAVGSRHESSPSSAGPGSGSGGASPPSPALPSPCSSAWDSFPADLNRLQHPSGSTWPLTSGSATTAG